MATLNPLIDQDKFMISATLIPFKSLTSRKPSSMVIVVLLAILTTPAQANVYDEPSLHPAIPLLDDDGNNVLDSFKPYSSKQSCGGCHDYDSITHAYHFETGRDEAADDFGEKRGLPQLISSGYFGGYNCMGGSNNSNTAKKSNTNAHDFADYGSPGLIKRCTTCHSGGGWMEKDRLGNRYDEVDPTTVAELDGDYFNRGTDENNNPADSSVVSQWDWQKSGVVENDCLLCHADFSRLKRFDERLALEPGRHDPPGLIVDPVALSSKLRTEMTGRGHFRYANTAIMEYLNLNISENEALDMAPVSFSRTDSNEDGIVNNNDLGLDEDGLPQLQWNTAAFDAEMKITIPMLRFAANENCMQCHRTSNSRRGFYGFGEEASATFDEDDGTLVEDYRDDVHKGKIWIEDGEERTIENCSACHAREYFKPASSNVSLDASHSFLKGNSDMDVRNDLDFNPAAKTCMYCHNDSPQAINANPSDAADMLTAHEQLWRDNGDMTGQPQSILTRITQTHLDVVSCEACHITGKSITSHGHEVPFLPMYRYREGMDGKLKISPYKPKTRSYWKDKNSDRVLNNFETREVSVDTRPTDYDGFIALKNAYDELLASKGVINPDTAQVIAEINHYVISHNTSPAVSSIQCEECHARDSDNRFTAALRADGLLGEQHTSVVATVLDPRLVDEGLVILDEPYMEMDGSGVVSENVSDILYHSRVDPSMTALGSARAMEITTAPQKISKTEAITDAGISNEDDMQLFNSLFGNQNVFRFQSRYGDPRLRDINLMVESNSTNDLVFPGYTLQAAIAEDTVAANAVSAELGGLETRVFSLRLMNTSAAEVMTLTSPAIIKIPYEGTHSNVDQLNVITSTDGLTWSKIDPVDILIIRPESDQYGGYIVFRVNHFSYYAATGNNPSIPGDTTVDADTGGGGSLTPLFLLFVLFGIPAIRYCKHILSRIRQ